MANDSLTPESQARLLAAGMSESDMAWLGALGWSDARVPPIKSDDELADYRRRERTLNEAIASLTFAERAETPEGKLAAALGARAADWADRDEDID